MTKLTTKAPETTNINICEAGLCRHCPFAEDCCYDITAEPVYADALCLSMALCQGRHSIPQATDGSIFGNEVDPLDVQGLEKTAFSVLSAYNAEADFVVLDLYVTGLTVALIAVVNVCQQLNIVLRLKHFNRETGEYYTQEVR